MNWALHFDENAFYHIQIWNNQKQAFPLIDDFDEFKTRYIEKIGPLFSTFAYCLLPDHFHFLIRKRKSYGCGQLGQILKTQLCTTFMACKENGCGVNWTKSGILENMGFSANKINPFHLTAYVSFINIDPETHGLVSDYTDYPHSSYTGLLTTEDRLLDVEGVMRWFCSGAHYVRFHDDMRRIHTEGKFISKQHQHLGNKAV